MATVTPALEVLGCSPCALFLETVLSDSLFLGGGITGRGGSSSMSGSSLRLIPKTSKGSGDPEPNLIENINFLVFSGSAVFQNRCALFCAHAYHTPMEKMDAQFFRIFPQFFVVDALFYTVDVQFYG